MFGFVTNMLRPQHSASDESSCPICLETFSDERTETCENGHRMHRGCAMQMHFHMTSHCPLCRSMLVCSACGSKKRNMRCVCSGIPDLPGHGWTMVKYQICLLVAILLMPDRHTFSISLVCIVNFGAMTHCLMKPEQKKNAFKHRTRSLPLVLKEIGVEVIKVLLISFSISSVYSWCVGHK